VWDTEELYDLNKDPDEMVNLINDPAYLDRKVALRHALFAQLADTRGRHAVPYTEKTSAGVSYRDENGTRAADFPPEFYTAPNLPSKMNGLFPDSAAKVEADSKGEAYRPGRTAH
jgi:hypothetical protein